MTLSTFTQLLSEMDDDREAGMRDRSDEAVSLYWSVLKREFENAIRTTPPHSTHKKIEVGTILQFDLCAHFDTSLSLYHNEWVRVVVANQSTPGEYSYGVRYAFGHERKNALMKRYNFDGIDQWTFLPEDFRQGSDRDHPIVASRRLSLPKIGGLP